MLLPSITPTMSLALFPSSSSTFPRFPLLHHTTHFSLHLPFHQCRKPLSLSNYSLHYRYPQPRPPSVSSSSAGESGELAAEERELLEGIAEIVAEAGVSGSESVWIAANSPQYAKMLRESVRELDELSLWNSWMKDGKMEMTHTPLLLKEKVKYIAREKGDYGKIPYLESIGLNFSSSVHLARLLSSESLPSLILKVKYVKEIFFSGSDDERVAGKLARCMMHHLSISVDEDVQQTLSFFEKIEARRGGLGMLGSCDASFKYLIESFPRLLLLSVESNMKPIVKFFENVGVPRKRMGNVLLLFPPLLFRELEEQIRAGSWPFKMVGALDKKFGRMLVKYPWVLSTGILKNYKDILGFFEAEKVPKFSIERAILDWPLLLGCSSGKLKPMVEQLDNLGVRTTKLGKVIATSPQLLLQRPEDFRKVVTFLQGLGFDNDGIGKILARCPEIFATRSENTLQQKLEFLTSLGILKQEVPRVIKKYPEFFVSDIDRTVVPRLRYLMKCGLTERNVASMIVRFSPLLGYSIEEVLRPKLEFLVNTMGKSVKEVLYYPRYFSYSLEKKIKPRVFVLRSRNIDCSLKDMLAKNDDEFATDYLGLGRMHVSAR
ncbi:transcription termination factor MTERF6, chloroplastic/mitochondrial [Spinacia oleracea]|uniref:Transcription termination factor MTERF6, chloroplastic/mitochondrial n=1 Tax=Spinacia oleracea TaxID=3562 RepID=A0A9R0IKS6_SPIOL|nr:transcription termination factor MTERF6, chloroplastic/mitochondrial [Spinacia oleracea]